MEGSAAEYLAAALESEDPEIAERATRVAIAARSWQYASMAADRWVMLEPESLDARQAAIQAMLVAGDYVAAEHQMAGLLTEVSIFLEEVAAVSMAVQNMWLTATAMDLGAFWGTPKFLPLLHDILELQSGQKALGFFYVGQIAMDYPSPGRGDIADKVEWME